MPIHVQNTIAATENGLTMAPRMYVNPEVPATTSACCGCIGLVGTTRMPLHTAVGRLAFRRRSAVAGVTPWRIRRATERPRQATRSARGDPPEDRREIP